MPREEETKGPDPKQKAVRPDRAAQFERYKNFKSVENWLNNLSDSEATIKGALYSLIRFCEHTGKNPEQLIDERAKQMASPDPRVKGRMDDTVSAFAKKVRGAYVYALYVKSFFKANHVPLSVELKRPAAKRENTTLPEDEKLQAWVHRIHSKTLKALALFLVDSGARDGSLLRLKYRHIKEEYEAGKVPCRVDFPAGITKGAIAYTGFVGVDALAAIKDMLRERSVRENGRALEDNDFVFVTKHGKPISKTSAIQYLQTYARHAGLIKSKTGLKEFRPHLLRSRVQTVLEGANIPLNWVDLLLGHLPRGSQGKSYSKPTTEQLREAYARAYPALRLFGPHTLKGEEVASAARVETFRAVLQGLTNLPQAEIDKIDLTKLTMPELRGILTENERNRFKESAERYFKQLDERGMSKAKAPAETQFDVVAVKKSDMRKIVDLVRHGFEPLQGSDFDGSIIYRRPKAVA